LSSLELRVPPDVVWIAVAALMWLVSTLTPGLSVPGFVRAALAASLFAVGIALIVAARVALDRANTTWLPSTPERTISLVTSGVFGYSRNPTYLGMWLVLMGWSAILADPVALVVTVLFVLYINRFQVVPEERVLTELIGVQYLDYRRRVRRWL